jgi:cytochrome b pre-mRNA-processing protein 3
VIFQRLFKARPSRAAGEALYAGAVAQARTPVFYADLGVADTLEGRFELYTLHVVLLVRRLKGNGPAAQETSQALFDAYLQSLDIALREMGIGDLSVGKKMKKLGRAFYGRVKSWEKALDANEDLRDLIGRTIYEGVEAPDTGPIAGYVVRAAAGLTDQSLDNLLTGEAAWPSVTL